MKLRNEGKLLLWGHSQWYQNNLQPAFQHLHYPFPQEQISAATEHCTVENTLESLPETKFCGGKVGEWVIIKIKEKKFIISQFLNDNWDYFMNSKRCQIWDIWRFSTQQ